MLNVQATCDEQRLFNSATTTVPSSIHDTQVFDASALQDPPAITATEVGLTQYKATSCLHPTGNCGYPLEPFWHHIWLTPRAYGQVQFETLVGTHGCGVCIWGTRCTFSVCTYLAVHLMRTPEKAARCSLWAPCSTTAQQQGPTERHTPTGWESGMPRGHGNPTCQWGANSSRAPRASPTGNILQHSSSDNDNDYGVGHWANEGVPAQGLQGRRDWRCLPTTTPRIMDNPMS